MFLYEMTPGAWARFRHPCRNLFKECNNAICPAACIFVNPRFRYRARNPYDRHKPLILRDNKAVREGDAVEWKRGMA
jgi:hypothetical protein